MGHASTSGQPPNRNSENIRAAIDRHVEETQRLEETLPDKATATKLLEDFQAFRRYVDEATRVQPGQPSPMKPEPPVPRELLDRIRAAVAPFRAVEFPMLQEFLRDPRRTAIAGY